MITSLLFLALLCMGGVIGMLYLKSFSLDRRTELAVNWFGGLILCNIVITFFILISYRSIKERKGIIGPSGYSGKTGFQGKPGTCGKCFPSHQKMEQEFEQILIRKPVLPEQRDFSPITKY